jgi:diguanylate cyclase (GGDEF)-like protein
MSRYSLPAPSPLARLSRQANPARLGNLALAALLLMAVLLALFVSLTISASSLQSQSQQTANHTREVLLQSARIRNAANETVRGERGYLLTSNREFLQPYDYGRTQLAQALAQLEGLTRDNPPQADRVAMLHALSDQFLATVAQIVALEQNGQHSAAVRHVRTGEGRLAILAMLKQLDAIEAVERELLAQRNAVTASAERRLRNLITLLGSIGVLLLALGVFATFALRRSLAREAMTSAELRRLATTDELTGLANRRELFASLDRMIATARRSGRPLSLAILDIDCFKLVNDLHGHPAGDEVIRRVSEMALAMMREQDLVGRLGGEEFVIVFPDCEATFALSASERLREGIAALPILLPNGKALQITLSFGVAQLHTADDRTTLIARADEALYRAKKGGRDQVQLAA